MPDALAHSLLATIVMLPAATALLLVGTGLVLGFLGLPALPERGWRFVGLGAAALTFALAFFVLALGFDPERIGFQQVEFFGWPGTYGSHLLLGVDGIGLCFLVVTTGLVPLAMLCSPAERREGTRSWVATCLLLESGLLGGLASINLMSFVFFWAASLLPALLWMGRWGGIGRARAASRVWTTEAIGLAGLLFVAFVLREASLDQLGVATLDLASTADRIAPLEATRGTANAQVSLLDVQLEVGDQSLLFVVLMIAMAIRLPLAPLHFWLPAAHASSPTGLSILIATGYVQTAAIGILRFALPLFPDAAREIGPALSLVGIGALVYASLIALVQKELKRLVAYTSIGYAGFAVFGISTLNVQGLTGAVIQILTHGLATAALFMLIGFLAMRRGTTEVGAFGGLAKPMPVCAFFFAVMVLSLVGLPLLGGFVGDLFVLLGSLETRRELSGVALTAMVVAASYLLWVQRRLFLGPVDEPANRGLIDLDRVERGVLLAITIPIVFVGVYPNPVLRRVEPAVLEILSQMERDAVPAAPSEPKEVEEGLELVERRAGGGGEGEER